MKYKDTDLSYLAGLFDIKGTIKIETDRKSKVIELRVWITDKNFRLMELLQRFGAHIGQKQDRQYRARWNNRQAFNLLKLLFPFLKVRRDQADVGIEFYESKLKNLDPKEYVIPLQLRLMLLKKETKDE